MPVGEPSWWYGDGPQWQASLLSPVAAVYGAVVVRRYRRTAPYPSLLPVLCAGNFTAGGAGKTPLALKLADIVRGLGHEPWFLSRGYGGRLTGPVRVEPGTHTAGDVGDEPLLLAGTAPTLVARDRRSGAEFIERIASAKSVIIMDDGLQNPSLAKDFTIAIVDGARGFGNGLVIPAGPLRAPITFQKGLVNAVIVMGDERARTGVQLGALQTGLDGPVLNARAAPASNTSWLGSANVVAYAGIANPERFFTMLESLGARIAERVSYADHHAFSDSDATTLIAAAQRHGAGLVTTEKDLARLAGATGAPAELKARSKTLPITLAFDDGHLAQLTAHVAAALARKR